MPALLEVIVPLIALGAGAMAGPLVRYARRLIDRRRYQAHVAALESAAEAAPKPLRPSLVVPRDLPEDVADELGSNLSYFFLTDLSVWNLRCFSEAALQLCFPGEGRALKYPNVNLLLGDNGSGKSTILRAAAMAALGPVLNSSGFVPFKLVTQGEGAAQVSSRFVFSGSQGPTLLLSDVFVTRRSDVEEVAAHAPDGRWADLFRESSPSFFIAGYGTNRRVAEGTHANPALEAGRRRRRYQRVVSLFDDGVSMAPLSSWLPQTDAERQEEVRSMLKEMLPQRTYFTGHFEGDDPVFSRRGVNVPLRAMSDGFRSYLSWVSDLLYQLDAVASSSSTKLDDIGGIVLVDEVDLLLHPSWQRVVVPTVSRLLPNIQFIFTTHSPIVAATLEPENIVVSREREQGRSVLERIDAEIHGLNAEQVLLSSYFGLDTTRAADVVPELKALAQRAVEGDSNASLEYLRALIRPESATRRKSRP